MRLLHAARIGKLERVWKVALAAIAGLVVVMALSTPAQAGTDASACSNYCDGSAVWQSYGDKMLICDHEPDGWSVVVDAYTLGGHAPYKWHTSGAGECTERSYGDLPEGTYIRFTVCLGDYSEGLILWATCGPDAEGYA